MSTVFKVYNTASSAWHDYSDMVRRSGMGWKRNDLDSDKSGRTLDGTMYRARVAQKRTVDYKLMPDKQSRYAALETDLSQTFFQVQYADLHGTMTKTFYCSSFVCNLDEDINDSPEWSGGSFTIIER